MKAIERFFEYLDYKGLAPTRLEKEIGLSNGYLSQQLKRKADIGEGMLKKILFYCSDLSMEWLIWGRGSMIIDNSLPIDVVREDGALYNTMTQMQKEKIDFLVKLSESKQEVIDLLKQRVIDLEMELSRKNQTQ
jgi:hypothetical protein